jgi:hypothetical protein
MTWFNRLVGGIELGGRGESGSEKGRRMRSLRKEEESRYTWKSVEGRQQVAI